MQRRLGEVERHVGAFRGAVVVFAHVGVAITVAFVLLVEKVVDRHTEAYAPQLARAQGVTQVEVGHAVALHRKGLSLLVGEILFAYIARAQYAFESSRMEVEEAAGNPVGRVREGLGAEILAVGGAAVLEKMNYSKLNAIDKSKCYFLNMKYD